MNEISRALRVINTTIKTVKTIDVIKKAVISASVVACCIITVKMLKEQKGI